MKQKGQLLILSFIMLLVVGVLAAGIMQIWEAQKQPANLHILNQKAFYAAQSGIEWAKAKLLSDTTYIGSSGWTRLDNSGGYVTYYNGNIPSSCNNVTCTVYGQGNVSDSSSQVLAEKKIVVQLTGVVPNVANGSCYTVSPYDQCSRGWACPCTCPDGTAPTMHGSSCECEITECVPDPDEATCPCTCPGGGAPSIWGSDCWCWVSGGWGWGGHWEDKCSVTWTSPGTCTNSSYTENECSRAWACPCTCPDGNTPTMSGSHCQCTVMCNANAGNGTSHVDADGVISYGNYTWREE